MCFLSCGICLVLSRVNDTFYYWAMYKKSTLAECTHFLILNSDGKLTLTEKKLMEEKLGGKKKISFKNRHIDYIY
jgi:hypothetical protein